MARRDDGGPTAKGMALRDWFAGQALIAYGSSPRVMDKAFDGWVENGGKRPTCIADFLAGLAYEVADSMLAERAKPRKAAAPSLVKAPHPSAGSPGGFEMAEED